MDLVSFLTGVLGGAIVLATEQIYLHFREKNRENRQKLIAFPHDERILPDAVFRELCPGSSIEFMKSVLGTPNKIYKDYDPIFPLSDDETIGIENKPEYTHAYLYKFKNAYLKITSQDKETIDSLAVEVNEGTLNTDLPLGWSDDENNDCSDCILGLSKVDQNLVDWCEPEYRTSRFENSFVLSLSTGPPLHTYYTYFGMPEYNENIETSKENPESFIGSTITGVCLHSNREDCYIITGFDLL